MRGIRVAKKHKVAPPGSKPCSIAILIVQRDSALGLKQLLTSMQDSVEPFSCPIYIMDDHSRPEFLMEIEKLTVDYGLTLLTHSAQAGKKNALQEALILIPEEYIIQLDADVCVSPSFGGHILKAIQNERPDLVVARVSMNASTNVWSRLGALDHFSLQLVTFSSLEQGHALMAAGAAMAYRRESHLKNNSIGSEWASGEDTFYAQTLGQKRESKITALPEAVVYTAAPQNFKTFIKQRLRWGAKSLSYPSRLAKVLALTVAVQNLALISTLIITLFEPPSIVWTFWLLKIAGDGLLLYRFAAFHEDYKQVKGYYWLALLYPFYIGLVVLLIPFAPRKKWL
jgi:cellulose synthase/poly-beta-1,6-N-acetylglucosamine synthase-like glycosyltransferase